MISKHDIQSLAEALSDIEQKLRLQDKYRTCLTCSDFNEQTEICQRFNARPPARIIVDGCEYWGDIPF